MLEVNQDLSCNFNGELSGNSNGHLSCNSNGYLSGNSNGHVSFDSNGYLSGHCNADLSRKMGLSCNGNGAGLPVAGAGMPEETKSKGNGYGNGNSNGYGACREEFNRRSILTESQVKELEKYCTERLGVPFTEPGKLYPQTPGFQPDIDVYSAFRLQHSDGAPITPDERRKALDFAHTYYTKSTETYLGYQLNMHEEYEATLSQYLNMHINNVGDPFSEGTFQPHSKFMERAVLDYFASLWSARRPHDGGCADSYWGYVLSMGASEGNLYGLWNGRDYLAGKVVLSDNIKSGHQVKATVDGATSAQRSFTPICFYSKDTHYSLKKCATILSLRSFHAEGSELYPKSCPKLPNRTKKTWPHTVPSNPDGSIDIEALAVLVEFFVKLGYPILVSFNCGTTFKGAYDDVEEAGERLMPILQKHGMYKRNIHFRHKDSKRMLTTTTVSRNGFWFHVDGALGAAYQPFIEAAYASKLVNERTGAPVMPKRGPNFDFRLPFVHSICASGHKWIGTPVPCGIYMSKSKYRLLPAEIPMYTATPDTTLFGSRSGLAAMFLWDFLSRNSMPQLVHRAIRSERTAQFLEDGLKRVERLMNADLYVSRSALSLSVIFKRPCDRIVHKYTLSSETRRGESFAHAFAMDHVSFDLITRFCNDLLCHGYPDELATLHKQNPKAYEEIMTLRVVTHPSPHSQFPENGDVAVSP